jgi:dephospho-CoA kinase
MILGLTGGIATGKSTATNFFKEKGYSVICADKIAREITEKTEILEEISKEFGNDVISEGKLNRKILREKVFIDKNKVKLLNEITHPAIIEEIKLEINKNAEESLVVLDIPLLFEGNYEFLVDKSLLIFCDENIQIERIKERDKVDTQNAINIIKNQLSLLEKKQRADYIIENNGTKEEFYKKLNSFLDKINDLNK